MEDEKLYSTRDLYFASTLLTLNFNLVSIDFQIEGMKNAPIGYFNFLNTPELAEVEQKFWARKIAIEPISFIDNLYNLKAQVTKIYIKPRVDTSARNIHFAALLLTLKFPLINIDFKREGPRQQLVGYFNFDQNEKLEKTKQDYLNKKIVVEPLLFVSNMRGIKAQVANVYHGPRTDTSKFRMGS